MSEMAKDPVCGMQVKVDGAKWVSQYGGRGWYFCSEGCRKRFEADPGRYNGLLAGSADSEISCAG